MLFALASVYFSVNAQTSWNTVHQNGYSLELPDYFIAVTSKDASTDVFANTNNKDIFLSVQSEPSDKMNFNSKYIADISNSGVTSKSIKDSVYTVSYTNGGTVNYRKSFLNNGTMHTLIVSYPDSKRSQFDLVLQRIGRSFK